MVTAKDLKSLDELNISPETKNYLRDRYSLLEEVIWLGRRMYYIYENAEYLKNRGSKFLSSTLELINALDEVGLIRHDIDRRSFVINRIRGAYYGEPVTIDDFLTESSYEKANEKYEEYQNPTADEIQSIRSTANDILTTREYEILMLRLGLETGPRDLDKISIMYNISKKRIYIIQHKALKKLRRHV